MRKLLPPRRTPLTVTVNDLMQKKYTYMVTEFEGKNFDPRFKPELTPKEMLRLGVFGGKYMTDCRKEFSKDWYAQAKLCHERHDPALNCFGINASQPLSVWQQKGWIHPADPRGWFQWYCRYSLGRRMPQEDDRQIKRWLAIRRHIAQIKKNCARGDLSCRRKQRQAVLHWAYDSRQIYSHTIPIAQALAATTKTAATMIHRTTATARCCSKRLGWTGTWPAGSGARIHPIVTLFA